MKMEVCENQPALVEGKTAMCIIVMNVLKSRYMPTSISRKPGKDNLFQFSTQYSPSLEANYTYQSTKIFKENLVLF